MITRALSLKGKIILDFKIAEIEDFWPVNHEDQVKKIFAILFYNIAHWFAPKN